MEYSQRAIYRQVCQLVRLKKETVKKLKKIYQEMPTKSEKADKPMKAMYVTQQPLHYAALMKEPLEQWLCKWKVMLYLKISKTTYYRWRKEGKRVPRNAVGEDRYFLEDLKNIVKKGNR